jgi:hypothetical protein
MADESRRLYGLQFHPEVTHSLQGGEILRRRARDRRLCGGLGHGNIIEDSVARCAQVGRDKVLLGCREEWIPRCWRRCYTAPSAPNPPVYSWIMACCASAKRSGDGDVRRTHGRAVIAPSRARS